MLLFDLSALVDGAARAPLHACLLAPHPVAPSLAHGCTCGETRHLQASPDRQWVSKPGYNRARGPARVLGVRVHVAI
ncbi:MAG: carbohydrate porin [Metallibacterium scheffleri]|jgi:hypothetical protein|uniref:hypothetical protein n=1 Tax=Metallibacterium scheffleri TaxID=993689 RepID=UPI0026ED8BEC|nr:hypothetical protein [Metallibacterium scheffleri]MCK9367055.1 carbohydrate porin [Metallibacterium scheffleri]